MKVIRILVAAALATSLAPFLGLAQSAENVCVTACQFEYERQIEKCTRTDREACVDAAARAQRTCLATCPGARRST